MLTLGVIDRLMISARENSVKPTASGHYILYISADARRYFVMIAAKARWKEHYRQERLARREANRS